MESNEFREKERQLNPRIMFVLLGIFLSGVSIPIIMQLIKGPGSLFSALFHHQVVFAVLYILPGIPYLLLAGFGFLHLKYSSATAAVPILAGILATFVCSSFFSVVLSLAQMNQAGFPFGIEFVPIVFVGLMPIPYLSGCILAWLIQRYFILRPSSEHQTPGGSSDLFPMHLESLVAMTIVVIGILFGLYGPLRIFLQNAESSGALRRLVIDLGFAAFPYSVLGPIAWIHLASSALSPLRKKLRLAGVVGALIACLTARAVWPVALFPLYLPGLLALGYGCGYEAARFFFRNEMRGGEKQ